jgi:hypothetical protein
LGETNYKVIVCQKVPQTVDETPIASLDKLAETSKVLVEMVEEGEIEFGGE